MGLRAFIVEFRAERLPLTCAVTARHEQDALDLIREAYGADTDLPAPVRMEALTAAAIQAEIGNFDFGVPVRRGIWYPHLENP